MFKNCASNFKVLSAYYSIKVSQKYFSQVSYKQYVVKENFRCVRPPQPRIE